MCIRDRKRFTKNIYVAFDGDDAGKKAALKCGYILSENSLEPRIITPPDGLDPDDWVRQDKGKSFQEAMKNGQKIIKSHYNYFSSIHSEGSLNIHDFIQECLDQLVNINNPIIHYLFSNSLSEKSTTVNAMIRNTVSLTKINSGYKTNIIPEYASAALDIRLLPDTSPESFLLDLKEVVNDDRLEFIPKRVPVLSLIHI